jgi:hypothetical protein
MLANGSMRQFPPVVPAVADHRMTFRIYRGGWTIEVMQLRLFWRYKSPGFTTQRCRLQISSNRVSDCKGLSEINRHARSRVCYLKRKGFRLKSLKSVDSIFHLLNAAILTG